MIAKLWTDEITYGRRTFSEVPAKLQAAVKKLLEESGHGEFAV